VDSWRFCVTRRTDSTDTFQCMNPERAQIEQLHSSSPVSSASTSSRIAPQWQESM
jgi:hypothetical protein